MQSSAKILLSVFLITSALAHAYHSSVKLRRDGVLNLYPFPRVGRSSLKSMPFNMEDLEEFEALPQKRQLYAFPRVGRARAMAQDEIDFHKDEGMWFGPRLGRSVRNNDDSISIHNENEGAPEQVETLERKKRQIKPQ